MDVASFKKSPISGVTSKITTAKQDTKVREALLVLQTDPNHLIAVVDNGGKLVGVVSHADVMKASPSERLLSSSLKDSGLITKDAVAVTMDMTVEDAVMTMQKTNLNKLIVVDAQGKPIALVTKISTLRAFDSKFKVKL